MWRFLTSEFPGKAAKAREDSSMIHPEFPEFASGVRFRSWIPEIENISTARGYSLEFSDKTRWDAADYTWSNLISQHKIVLNQGMIRADIRSKFKIPNTDWSFAVVRKASKELCDRHPEITGRFETATMIGLFILLFEIIVTVVCF